MPKENGIGWSDSTALKLLHFDQMIRPHQGMVQGIQRNAWVHPAYCFLDVNAGSGESNGQPGTSLLALRSALERDLPIRAWLFERQSGNADALEQRVADLGLDRDRVRVVRGDHARTAAAVAAELHRLRGCVYGVVVADPTGTRLPTVVMRALAHAPRQSKLDVFAYAAPATYKRVDAVWGGGRILDDLRAVGLPHLLLRHPDGHAQWTWAILTRWPGFPEFRTLGFRRVGTPEGDALAERLDLTAKEWEARHQLELPFGANGHTEPTPTTFATPASARFGPKSSAAPAAGVNGADGDRREMPTTFAIPSGEDSTCPTT